MLVFLKRIPYQVFDNFPWLCGTRTHSLFSRTLKPQVLWLAMGGGGGGVLNWSDIWGEMALAVLTAGC